jgi:energy-coupling factor transporter ATP-binding protein EcfA2
MSEIDIQDTGKITVQHTAFTAGLRSIQQAYNNVGRGTPSILTVLGPSGSGKSTLLKFYQNIYTAKRLESGVQAPILYFRAQPRPTEKSIAFLILEALGDDFCYHRVSEFQMTARATKLIKKCGVKAIFIDEIQHFTERWKQPVVNQAADWIKNLAEETKILLVLAGTPEAIAMFEYNKQLRRRVLEHIQIPQFDWANLRSRMEFCGILKGFKNQMTGFLIPNIYEEQMANAFWIASTGLTGLVAKLLEKTSRDVLDRLECLKQNLEKATTELDRNKIQAAIDELFFVNSAGNKVAKMDLADFEIAFDKIKGLEHNGIENPFSVLLGENRSIKMPSPELHGISTRSEPKSRGFKKREMAGVFHA